MNELNRQAAAATFASNMADGPYTYSSQDNFDTELPNSPEEEESVMKAEDLMETPEQLTGDVIIEDKMAATAELLEMVELGGEHIDNTVDDDFNTIKKSAKVSFVNSIVSKSKYCHDKVFRVCL